MKIDTGKWTERELDRLIGESANIRLPGDRIAFLSAQFLGVDYREATLTGGPGTVESLVVDLSGVDCFTFIDYVEAMRLSESFPGFIGNLRKIRYNGGLVSYEARNHFFTDWGEFNRDFVEEVSEEVGGTATAKALKVLNQKKDGTWWVPGIGPRQREIRYIPTAATVAAVEKLKSGDYAGIYSEEPGLDVSHVGIVIKDKEKVFLRHASSKHKKVVDEDLIDYLTGKPGLLVLRPGERYSNR